MPDRLCTTCYAVGAPKQESNPVALVGFLVAIAFLFVPVPYQWRWVLWSAMLLGIVLSVAFRNVKVCGTCRGRALVPADSERGRQLIAERGGAIAGDAAPATDTKACPSCAETIKLAAVKCRFCGEAVT